MTDSKNTLFFVVNSIMFITGLSLLGWDIRMRSLDVDQSLEDRMDIMGIDTDIISDISNQTAPPNAIESIDASASATTTPTTSTTTSGAKCLTFEETFDNLVTSSSTIFLTMPAKAAGFSLQEFTKQCVGGAGGGSNPLNEAEKKENIFYAQLTPPKILSSHIFSDETMIDMFQNVPRRSLIVYLHRNENDRFLSAIRQVVIGTCKSPKESPMGVNLERDGSRCTLDEKDVVDKLIKPKPNEIGMGNNQIMTCDFYRAMEDNIPTMVFVHYSKADDIQNVLAKYHCPKLVGKPIRINTEEDKSYIQAYTRLSDGSGKEIELGEWMEAKRDLFEFTFQLRSVDKGTTTCQSKTRNMEDDLLSCEDEIMEITRKTLF
eukprot:CAMPEP_0203691752 /NCGR_PEP_ID=MMETSP0091-20130426/4027_1 /ASSEMBLY_ACC=CAM_ASM_001089 /TAXON_ID=426623 /ORGANISM="Chaetoceros affinis, Strain CCMP159" /LENGTH=374 /DNA_ID=CAMNT_0050562381 /DNA_START=84 /DNA_END=1208 /DNA_ORIENTATION=+